MSTMNIPLENIQPLPESSVASTYYYAPNPPAFASTYGAPNPPPYPYPFLVGQAPAYAPVQIKPYSHQP